MLSGWFTKSELYLLIGVLVSLFSQEIRTWFRGLFQKQREATIGALEVELASLEYMHENAYGLLLYLALNTLDGLRAIAIVGFIVFAIHMILISTIKEGVAFTPVQFLIASSPMMAAKVFFMYGRVRNLNRYDERCTEIRNQLTKLSPPPPPPPPAQTT